jgi:hypothetical protein
MVTALVLVTAALQGGTQPKPYQYPHIDLTKEGFLTQRRKDAKRCRIAKRERDECESFNSHLMGFKPVRVQFVSR